MKGKQPGEFKSIDGKTCSIVGNHFVLDEGFDSNKRIRITSTSFRALENNVTVYIYHTNEPFMGGMKSPEEYDEIGSVLANKYVAILRTFPDIEQVVLEMNKFIQDIRQLAELTALDGFRLLKPSLHKCLQTKWQYFVKVILMRLNLDQINSSRQQHGYSQLSTDFSSRLTPQHIEQVVESYLLKTMSGDITAWLKLSMKAEQEVFMASLRLFAQVSLGQIITEESFRADQSAAIDLLVSMHTQTSSPVDKLLIMKDVVSMIQETVALHLNRKSAKLRGDRSSKKKEVGSEKAAQEADLHSLENIEFATDDLVSVLIWVLLVALLREPDLYIDFYFARQYHFTTAATSPIAFSTCHFEVALHYLGEASNAQSLLSANKIANAVQAANDSAEVKIDEESIENQRTKQLLQNEVDSGNSFETVSFDAADEIKQQTSPIPNLQHEMSQAIEGYGDKPSVEEGHLQQRSEVDDESVFASASSIGVRETR